MPKTFTDGELLTAALVNKYLNTAGTYVQYGSLTVPSTTTEGTQAVTFPTAYSAAAGLVLALPMAGASFSNIRLPRQTEITATGFNLRHARTTGSGDVTYGWIAIGVLD